jgi:transcriptional regulator with GAF, ATPase, and Fis domain
VLRQVEVVAPTADTVLLQGETGTGKECLPADIPLLVRHFVRYYARQLHKRIDIIPAEALQALTCYCWPGNGRQLQRVIERAVILSPGPVLHLPLAEVTPPARGVSSRGRTLKEVERSISSRPSGTYMA